MDNKNLHKAKNAKNDEFYTQHTDIEKELKHYKGHFKDKVVYCNCDDPYVSAFFGYFTKSFEHLGLKKLITTCYKSQTMDLFSQNDSEQAIKLEYTGGAPNSMTTPDDIGVTYLEGDGDFRSQESIELLKKADIVVTNPPFSLFREYVAQLIKYDKKFLIVGNMNAITYKEIFPLIKENKMWVGYNFNKTMEFKLPFSYKKYNRIDEKTGAKYGKVPAICWYTNLNHTKRNEDLILFKRYTPGEYPKYDNYDAINVDRVALIPMDYDGVMGVPITFMDKYSPEQFEILSSNDCRLNDDIPFKEHGLIKDKDGTINGVPTYVRIVIRNKRLNKENDESTT